MRSFLVLAAAIALATANPAAQSRPLVAPAAAAIYERLLPQIERIKIFDHHAHPAFPDDTDVDIANLNAPGQIVISGESAKMEMAVSLAKEHGIRRATLLNVAGAYHSRLMNSAYEQLGEPLLEATLQVPRFPVMSNVTGGPVDTLPEIRATLQDQVTSTVRWTECMDNLLERGCDLFIELGPGEVLAGLLRRTRKDANVVSVSDPASVHACVEKLREI